MSGRRFETVLTSTAYAAIIVTVESIRAHRSSLWAVMTVSEWIAFAVAWLIYTIVIFAVAYAVRFAMSKVSPEPVDVRPSLIAPPIVAAIIVVALLWAADFEGASGAAFAVILLAALAVTQYLHWRAYLATVNAPSIIAIAACSGAIMSLTVHDNFRFARENAANEATINALGSAALIGSLFQFGHLVLRKLWQRESLAGLTAPTAWFVVGIAALVIGHFDTGSSKSPQAPSIILVTADTLRADVLSVYGGAVETPNLETIANQSATFDRAYTLAPWTLPSVFGMMTSQYPPHLSPDGDYKRWSKEISLYRFPNVPETFAERLRDRGYATGACIANSLLRDREGVLRGFDTVRVIGHRTHTLDGLWRAMPWLQKAMHRMGAPGIVEKPADTTRVCAAFAESFLRMHKGKPVFLWIHFMDPHTAYAPPPQFAPKGVAWPIYCNADPHWGTPLSDAEGNVDVNTAQRVDIRALYDGEVRYIDEAAGRVWTAMHENMDDAIFVFSSDHGEAFWEHENYGHGQSLYDHQVRVPMMIAHPDVDARRIETPVSQIDLLPTLADAAGADRIDTWVGSSWWNALTAPNNSLSESPIFSQATNVYTPGGPLVMTMDGMTKAIYNQRTRATHLYDLESDPGEMRPTEAGADHALAVRIEQHLNAHGNGVADVFARDHATGANDEELVEQLRAMGYIN